ncbi:MAG: M6 family metalloprotease domain-containing protein [Dysgonamonadaceae bacterium]|jgi:M6 family metalloprotease-like protein|nr:M6 family metalloprotease domain-containing protein [Dysgonamonadaceae bacterium]
MKKYLFSLLSLLLLSNTLFAAFITNFPIEVQQPNGETVQLYVTGDEFHRRVHDADGFTIIKDPQTGYLVYAVLKNDELVSSGYFVGKTDPQTVGLTPDVDISAEKRRQIRQRFLDATPENPTLRASAVAGTRNNIVVYIRFSDDPEFTQSPGYFADLFNKDAPGASLYRYFNDISHGQLNISSTFYPIPTGTTVLSYKDSYPRSTFENVTDQMQQAALEHALLERAIDAIENEVPTDLNLDTNNDGYVDNICFIVKGNPGAWNTLLWPHQWYLFSRTVKLHGKRVWAYTFQIENHLISSSGRQGVLVHEMYHSLGAPDYYRYENTTINPVGIWDVMASTSANPPQSSTAWVSHKYAPWVTPEITEITQPGTYTINNVWSETNNCYKIASPNSTKEFFLIEYRDRNVIWDTSSPGSGLIIYRVNSILTGNASGPPDEVYVFRPGASNTTTNGNLNNAYFSSQIGRTTFSDTSNPPAFLSNNTSGLEGIIISDIGASGGETMSFKVAFMPKPDFTIEISGLTVQFVNTSLTFSEATWLWDFGDGTPTSTEKNPKHTYNAAGYYNVKLTAENSSGKRDKTIRIAVGIFCGGNGSNSDPYLICTAAEFDAMRDNISAYYKLANDIDLSDYLAEGGDGYAKWSSAGWMPIGNSATPFTGSLDGGSHKITGLWIDRPTNHIGLFSYVTNAKIKNLGVETAAMGINGSSYVGGLVGYLDTSTSFSISNSYVAGNVSGSSYIGGLVGYLGVNSISSISNSYATGNVNGTNSIGGLVGYQKSPVDNSYVTSDVRGSSYVGGLVGYQDSGSSIDNSYVTGDVRGNNIVGGLVGYKNVNSASIRNSYVTGNIDGNSNTGGIVGSLTSISGLSNNYHYEFLRLDGSIIVDTDPNSAHNRKHGAAISLAKLRSLTFFNTLSNWQTAAWYIAANNNRTWTIWEGKSYPYFSFQSAPLYNLAISSSTISFELRNAAKSIQIYNSRTDKIETLGAQTAGIKNIDIQSLSANFLQKGDILQFVVYETGKTSSYPVSKEVPLINALWEHTKNMEVNVYEANGLIQIVSNISNPISEVVIYSLDGRLLHKETLSGEVSHTINRNWSAGIYIVKVVSEKNINNIKLIIK